MTETCWICEGDLERDGHRPGLSRFDNDSDACWLCCSAEALGPTLCEKAYPTLTLAFFAEDRELWKKGVQMCLPDVLEYHENVTESLKTLKELELVD